MVGDIDAAGAQVRDELSGSRCPGEILRVASDTRPVDLQRSKSCRAQIRIEDAGDIATDNVDRPRHGIGRHGGSASHGLDQDQTERIGPARKHKDVRFLVATGEILPVLHAVKHGIRVNFGDQIEMVMFLKNASIAGGFLLLVANGAGPLSLDRRLAA